MGFLCSYLKTTAAVHLPTQHLYPTILLPTIAAVDLPTPLLLHFLMLLTPHYYPPGVLEEGAEIHYHSLLTHYSLLLTNYNRRAGGGSRNGLPHTRAASKLFDS